jgi:Fe-S-cluster-containing dehydrogenase component/CRP-like cAMP-binding protein
MGKGIVAVQRPQRWDLPFSPQMAAGDVNRLMQLAPFRTMNEAAFSPSIPLRGILQNDCRINVYKPGDVVIKQGDYGNSAFLILQGQAIVAIGAFPFEGQNSDKAKPKSSLSKAIAGLWSTPRVAESRDTSGWRDVQQHLRESGDGLRWFVQDIPRVFSPDEIFRLHPGDLFGELAALTRTPRSATVVAETPCEMLEIRWQGLRDLMKRDNALRDHVESLYRRNSLRGQLQLTPVIGELDEQRLQEVAAETVFENFGEFEWNRQFRSLNQKDIAERIQAEPVVAREGTAADSVFLIRNGFARLSRQYGDGHRTIAYLGKGQVFGLRELSHNWRVNAHRPFSMTLRAVGYLDVIRIPQLAMEQLVFPHVGESCLPPLLPEESGAQSLTGQSADRRKLVREPQLETGLLEFLVEGRYINGSHAMVIDLDRCTRCDDCVRACAATHDNNPRFVREGDRHGNWMIASACMHCLDPVCMIGCPTGAIGRDAETGNVLINEVTCIGCGTCSASCPYQNIRMVEIRNNSGQLLVDQGSGKPILKATKCDFCHSSPGGPACQRACPHDALYRVDLTQPLPLYQIATSR